MFNHGAFSGTDTREQNVKFKFAQSTDVNDLNRYTSMCSVNNRIVVASGNAIKVLQEGSTSHSTIHTRPVHNVNIGTAVGVLTDVSNTRIMWAMFRSPTGTPDPIYVSRDTSGDWSTSVWEVYQAVDTPGGGVLGDTKGVTCNPSMSQIYVATDKGVWVAGRSGTNWGIAGGGLPSTVYSGPTTAIARNYCDGKRIVFADLNTIYVRKHDGSSWVTELSWNAESIVPASLTVNHDCSEICYSTPNDGLITLARDNQDGWYQNFYASLRSTTNAVAMNPRGDLIVCDVDNLFTVYRKDVNGDWVMDSQSPWSNYISGSFDSIQIHWNQNSDRVILLPRWSSGNDPADAFVEVVSHKEI